MNAEQIQAGRLAGESLLQIAASKDPVISEDELISTILDAKKDHPDRAGRRSAS